MKRVFTIGKLRGLQQLSDSRGIFAMCAMDHRGSLQRALNPESPERVGAGDLTAFKLDLVEMLAPAATAVLLDPIYGAAQAIASGLLPRECALIVSVEETGYEETPGGRITTLLPDWSVRQIKRMGGAAVKLLLYYRPDQDAAAQQRTVVDAVAGDCVDADIVFVLEPLLYPVSAAERASDTLEGTRADLVIRSARDLASRGPDVLKVEFPGRGLPPDHWADVCARLDATIPIPWVLLSGGATFDEFARWVEAACRAGASGFLGGRAVWEDVLRMPDRDARRRWLATTGVQRLRRLTDIASEFGRPWWKKYAERLSDLAGPDSAWYRTYPKDPV